MENNQQLAIDVPIDHSKNSTYATALAEYLRISKIRDFAPVFLCLNTNNDEYFVSKVFRRKTIEKHFTKIKIIQ